MPRLGAERPKSAAGVELTADSPAAAHSGWVPRRSRLRPGLLGDGTARRRSHDAALHPGGHLAPPRVGGAGRPPVAVDPTQTHAHLQTPRRVTTSRPPASWARQPQSASMVGADVSQDGPALAAGMSLLMRQDQGRKAWSDLAQGTGWVRSRAALGAMEPAPARETTASPETPEAPAESAARAAHREILQRSQGRGGIVRPHGGSAQGRPAGCSSHADRPPSPRGHARGRPPVSGAVRALPGEPQGRHGMA